MTWLDEAKRLAAAMTAGPWEVDTAFCTTHQSETPALYHQIGDEIVEVVESGCTCDDLEFDMRDAEGIAFLRNSLPELIALVETISQWRGDVLAKWDVDNDVEAEERIFGAVDKLDTKAEEMKR